MAHRVGSIVVLSVQSMRFERGICTTATTGETSSPAHVPESDGNPLSAAALVYGRWNERLYDRIRLDGDGSGPYASIEGAATGTRRALRRSHARTGCGRDHA